MGENGTIYMPITADNTVSKIEDVLIQEKRKITKIEILSLRELDVILASLYEQRDTVDAKILAHSARLNDAIAKLEELRAIVEIEARKVQLIDEEVT